MKFFLISFIEYCSSVARRNMQESMERQNENKKDKISHTVYPPGWKEGKINEWFNHISEQGKN